MNMILCIAAGSVLLSTVPPPPSGLSLPQLGWLAPRTSPDPKDDQWMIGCELQDRDFTKFSAYKDYLPKLGIRSIRLQGGWAKCEREKGKYDFAWLDEPVDFALSHGLNPVLETDYGNPLYKGGGGRDLAGGFPYGEEGLAAWDRWVDALSRHFAGRVRDWAMWNEPDIGNPADTDAVGGHHTPEAIAAFNVRTAKIIRRNIPDARIAGLSLATNDPKFNEACYKAFGSDIELFWRFIYHGYVPAPESSYANVMALKKLCAKYAPHATLWQGENGAPSEMPGDGLALNHIAWSEVTQAKWDLRRMLGDLVHGVPSSVFTTTAAPCVIMVFGSQNGGGKAILDTVKPVSGNTGNLARSSSSTGNPWTAYNAGFGLTTDGVGVTPNSDKPNGGWQIVSLDASKANAVFEGLGAHQSGANVPGIGMTGGMNYAEAIFFSEELTEEERIACECYLAEKWGLKSAYSCVADVSPCVSVEGGDNATIYVNSGTDFAWLDGDFAGTINVSGGKDLLLDEKPLPPTEKDVPQDGLVGWYDPSFAGALTYHTASGHTDEMEYLYNRTPTGVDKTTGYKLRGSAVNGEKTRSPVVVEVAKGGVSSPVRPWLDFSKDSSSSSVEGNTIRLTDATAGEGGTARSLTIRQGFIALDSSLGGGNPIGDNVEFSSGKIRRRTGNVVTAPIWSSDNAISMTSTWLDTTAVDGTKTGFNGRPEVLSFTTTENYGAGYFGDYNGNKGNYEILGEILLYSSPLPDAARTTTQEYLMYKWFGDRNGKYSNLAGATVTGAGRICVQNLAALPKFSPDFSGPVALSADELSLSALAPATLPNDVELPDAVVANVTVDETIDIGMYPLLTASGTLSGASSITVNVIGGSENLRYRVRKVGASLVLAVAGRGMALFIR